mgnify:CR=1 FL=1
MRYVNHVGFFMWNFSLPIHSYEFSTLKGQQTTDIQSSDTETTPADLSRAIDNLEKNLDSISRSQRSGRATVLGGSLILLLMIVVFGFTLFKTLKTQLNEDTLQAALQEKAEQMLSMFFRRLAWF